jgi:hypothetical protein
VLEGVVFFLCFLAFLGVVLVAVAGFGSSPKARAALPIIKDIPNSTVINFFMKQFLLGISERQKELPIANQYPIRT